MNKLKWNIFANFIGRGWSIILGVAFIPVYLKFLGIEAYGLIGFYTALRSIFGLMDFGFSATLNRELARLSVLDDKAQEQRDLLRTLEIIYWLLSFFAGLLVFVLAPIITHRWVSPQHLPTGTVEDALRLMGLVIALQFPFSFYQGGLMGLQRQVLMNTIIMLIGTLRGAGAVLVLWLISPSITAFFTWQIITSGIGTLICVFYLWQSLPTSEKSPKFNGTLLIGVWRFTASVSINAIVGVLLTQLDKVILSKMLSLTMFGYYTLAATVASFLWAIIVPVNSALFPKFAQLVEVRDDFQLANLYHRSCQFIAVVLVPIALTIALFSHEVMLLWTRNAITAENTYMLVTLLVIGTMLNGLASVPGYLQFAAGWPQLTMYTNLFSAVILVPALVFMASHYGGLGAAIVWVLLNSGYMLFTVPIMHRRLLKAEKWRWYVEDVGIPSAAVIVLIGLARWLMPEGATSLSILLYLAAVWFLATTVCTLIASQVRASIRSLLWRKSETYGV